MVFHTSSWQMARQRPRAKQRPFLPPWPSKPIWKTPVQPCRCPTNNSIYCYIQRPCARQNRQREVCWGWKKKTVSPVLRIEQLCYSRIESMARVTTFSLINVDIILNHVLLSDIMDFNLYCAGTKGKNLGQQIHIYTHIRTLDSDYWELLFSRLYGFHEHA